MTDHGVDRSQRASGASTPTQQPHAMRPTMPNEHSFHRASFLAVILSLLCFVVLAVAVEIVRKFPFDNAIINLLDRHLSGVQSTDIDLVELLSLVIPAAGGVAAGVLLLGSRRREGFSWALSLGGLLALDPVLKTVFRRPAISAIPGDYSFPSGSAMLSTAVVLALVLTLPRGWRVAASTAGALLLVVYGAMIVEARWHYPSDVVAGWCAAIAWTVTSWLVVSRAWGRNTRRGGEGMSHRGRRFSSSRPGARNGRRSVERSADR